MTIVCKNCKNHFKGKFCSHCGQSADTHDINMHYLWHEIQHGVLHFDSGIVFTTKQLFTRPGHAIRDFINGKRVQYFKPLAFVFVLATIYGVLTHYFGIKNFLDGIQIGENDFEDPRTIDLINNLNKNLIWLRDHYAYSVLLALPITSLASYLAFRKKGGNYLKHIILNAYLIGQRRIVNILFIPLVILPNNTLSSMAVNIQTIIELFLVFWAYNQYFNYNPGWKNTLRTLLTYLYLGLILSAAMFYIWIKAQSLES